MEKHPCTPEYLEKGPYYCRRAAPKARYLRCADERIQGGDKERHATHSKRSLIPLLTNAGASSIPARASLTLSTVRSAATPASSAYSGCLTSAFSSSDIRCLKPGNIEPPPVNRIRLASTAQVQVQVGVKVNRGGVSARSGGAVVARNSRRGIRRHSNQALTLATVERALQQRVQDRRRDRARVGANTLEDGVERGRPQRAIELYIAGTLLCRLPYRENERDGGYKVPQIGRGSITFPLSNNTRTSAVVVYVWVGGWW